MWAQFDVSNARMLPLKDVSVSVGLGQVTTGGRVGIHGSPNFGSRLVTPYWQHHSLSTDERFTVSLSGMFRGATQADFEIVVDYRPWLLPLKCEKIFRFVTDSQGGGRVIWKAWPAGEPAPPQF